MAKYGILRVEKIKLADGGGLKGRAMHDFREFPNATKIFDKHLSETNEYIGCANYSELREKAAARWNTLTGSPRSDAVGMLEVVVTTTAGALKKGDEKQFFEDVHKEVSSWYGAENVLGMAIHRDETTPHCHVFLTPIETVRQRKKHLSEAEKRLPDDSELLFSIKTQLNAKRLLNGRNSLSQLQTDFHKRVFKKYGLERGEIGTNEKTKNQRSSLKKKQQQIDGLLEDAKAEKNKATEKAIDDFKKITKIEREIPKPKFNESAKEFYARIAPMYAQTEKQWENQWRKNQKFEDEKKSAVASAVAEKDEEIKNLQFEISHEAPFYEKDLSKFGLKQQIKKLNEKNQNLEKQLTETKERLDNWRNTPPDELEKIASDYRSAGVKNWEGFTKWEKSQQQSRSGGRGERS